MLILYLLLFAILSVAITIFSANFDKIFNFAEQKSKYENDIENTVYNIRKYMFYDLLLKFKKQKTLISERESILIDEYETQIGSINSSKTYLDQSAFFYNNSMRAFFITGIFTSPTSVIVTFSDFYRFFDENQIFNITLGISYIFILGIPISLYLFYLHKKYKKTFKGIYESVKIKLDYIKLEIIRDDLDER